MVKVAIIGATGKAGSRVQEELWCRGHSVIAITRDPLHVIGGSNVEVRTTADVETADLVPLIEGAEVIVHAYAPPIDDTQRLVPFTSRVIEAIKRNGKSQRLVMVGGAGGLIGDANGGLVIDQAWFPESYKPIAQAHIDAFEVVRGSDINWTTLAPPLVFQPGEKTGKFRIGGEALLVNKYGSSISMEDYAIVLVDEIENPRHFRARFTCGY
eukprot:gene19462-23004_t